MDRRAFGLCVFVRRAVGRYLIRRAVGHVQGVVCIRLPRIGLYFCELGHCDWRNVVLAYVPTAQTPIAQGIALGMPAPDDPLPQQGNMIDVYARPVGLKGHSSLGGTFVPRALPWAITVCPVGQRCFAF